MLFIIIIYTERTVSEYSVHPEKINLQFTFKFYNVNYIKFTFKNKFLIHNSIFSFLICFEKVFFTQKHTLPSEPNWPERGC